MSRLETAETVLTLVATLTMGFLLGVQYTGRLAYPARRVPMWRGHMMIDQPEWISHAKLASQISILVFIVCVVGATWLYVKRDG
jgi:branched-subunit amino acid ABC-type transport system permease component